MLNECVNCHTKVIKKSDGSCPSCGQSAIIPVPITKDCKNKTSVEVKHVDYLKVFLNYLNYQFYVGALFACCGLLPFLLILSLTLGTPLWAQYILIPINILYLIWCGPWSYKTGRMMAYEKKTLNEACYQAQVELNTQIKCTLALLPIFGIIFERWFGLEQVKGDVRNFEE